MENDLARESLTCNTKILSDISCGSRPSGDKTSTLSSARLRPSTPCPWTRRATQTSHHTDWPCNKDTVQWITPSRVESGEEKCISSPSLNNAEELLSYCHVPIFTDIKLFTFVPSFVGLPAYIQLSNGRYKVLTSCIISIFKILKYAQNMIIGSWQGTEHNSHLTLIFLPFLKTKK